MIRKVLYEFEMKFPWYIDTKAFNSICKADSLGLLLGCSCIFLSLHVNSFQLSSNFRQVSFIGSGSRSTQNPLGRERISTYRWRMWRIDHLCFRFSWDKCRCSCSGSWAELWCGMHVSWPAWHNFTFRRGTSPVSFNDKRLPEEKFVLETCEVCDLRVFKQSMVHGSKLRLPFYFLQHFLILSVLLLLLLRLKRLGQDSISLLKQLQSLQLKLNVLLNHHSFENFKIIRCPDLKENKKIWKWHLLIRQTCSNRPCWKDLFEPFPQASSNCFGVIPMSSM